MKTIMHTQATLRTHAIVIRLVLLLLAAALSLTSCKKDNEPAPDAVPPFEGKFEVRYDDPADNYIITISRHTDQPNTVKMLNFGDFMNSIPVYGQVSGNRMTIATQTYRVNNGKKLTITGEGTLTGNTLKIHFMVGGDYAMDRTIDAIRQ